MKPIVFVTCTLPGDELKRLEPHCELRIWPDESPPSVDELRSGLSGASGLICLLTNRVDRSLLNSFPDLNFVSSMSVGVDHVDVAALTERSIPLGNTPGVLVETTADLTWSLLLAAARRVPEAERYLRGGQWTPQRPWFPDMLVGKDVAGATLGVIGLGQIGQAVLRRGAGFGMRLIGWTPSGRELPGVESPGFAEVLAQADFLCICIALGERTRMLIDSRAIAAMKAGAVLVNTARGGIVDEQALAAALQKGHLYAAALDVYEQEPVPLSNPLLSLENVVAVPHIGSASVATRAAMARLAVDNAQAALGGQPMPHCVNPGVYE